MPSPERHGPVNADVALHDEAAADARAVREFAGVERIFWVQCPRCRLRLWYALRYDTGRAEIQYFGAAFRRRFLSEACDAHSRAPLAESEAGAWKKRDA